MFYVFLFIISVLAVGVYLLFFLENVPGAKEERLGELEPLPEDVGTWKQDESAPSADGTRQREVRLYFDESRGKLLRQVRYRDLATNEIVSVEPDQVLKRRRIRRS